MADDLKQLHIAVVDDRKSDRNRIAEDIQSWALRARVSLASMRQFASGEEFLAAFSPGEWDIVFLDILMDQLNGIQTAERIRELDMDVLLIFLTSSQEFAFDAFPVHPFDYLIKPHSKERIFSLLTEAMRMIAHEEPEITVRSARTSVSVQLRSISAVVSQGHNVEIVRTDGTSIVGNSTFTEVSEQLQADPRFLLVNRGVLINMDQVSTLMNDAFVMKDGSQYALRVRGRAQVVSDFSRYQLSRMRGQRGGTR